MRSASLRADCTRQITYLNVMQSKYWCITDNVHVDQAYWQSKLEADSVQYGIAQPESGDQEHHLHVQNFTVFKARKRFGVVREYFPGAHVEAMRGTPAEAAAYCKKDDTWTRAWRVEVGDLPESKQGRRNDLENIRDEVKAGKSLIEIIDVVPGALRYMGQITRYRSLLLSSSARPAQINLLRSWQEDLYRLLDSSPLARSILWVWCLTSAVGKTTTMTHYMSTRPGRVVIGTPKLQDLLFPFDELITKVIWFDLSRAGQLDSEMLTILEQVSNGTYLMSTKYEPMLKFVQAHVVVTANVPPPVDRLPNRITEFALDENGERVVRVPFAAAPGNWANPEFYYDLQ